ncbi:hypothetical protein [Alteriqipengyuania sp. 357]
MAPMIAISALTSACGSSNEDKFCKSIDMPSVEMSPVTNWRGEVVAYEGKDRNGLPLRVDPSNSEDWICLTATEVRERKNDMQMREAQRVSKLEKECAEYDAAGPSFDAILACERLEVRREEAQSEQQDDGA